jgi:hypothetical protein
MSTLQRSSHRSPGRAAFVCALGLALALVFGVSNGRTTNTAPNPSFEDVCDGGACFWPSSAFGGRDDSVARTGQASYRLVIGAGVASSTGSSTCVPRVLTYLGSTLGFWYRYPGGEALTPNLDVYYYTGPDCTGLASEPKTVGTPLLADGAWHQTMAAPAVPAGVNSFRMVLRATCPGVCGGGSVLNFDDLVLDEIGTATTLATFNARREKASVRLRWHTARETSLLGFNLYRRDARGAVRLNRGLIRSVFGGTPVGRAYSFLDRRPTGSRAVYALEAVELNGIRTILARTTIPR